MSGIKLTEIDASDMLDVLHYFFEEDVRSQSQEEIKVNNSIRDSIYETIYEGKYKRVFKRSNEPVSYDFDMDEPLEKEAPIKPFNPRVEKAKSYVPPTPVFGDSTKPFGNILEEPLG